MWKKKTTVIFLIMLLSLLTISCGAGSQTDAFGPEESPEQEEQQGEEIKEEEQQETDIDETEEVIDVNTDVITINSQSSIRIEGSKIIYVDPFKRSEAPHDADIIFITHAHYDHYDEPSLRNVANAGSVIVCPESMLSDVAGMGIIDDDSAIVSMNAGDEEEIADGIKAVAVPAYNLNKNFHPRSNGWLGYIITMDGVRYYAAGDTDALPELEDVECDIALVPVGGTYTMTATEAAGLINKIKPEYAIPIHYGTIVGRAADADTFGAALDKDITMVRKVEDAK